MVRTSLASSELTLGRPTRPRRDFQVQKARKPLPVPADHGLEANDMERLAPTSPLVGEPHPEETLERPNCGRFDRRRSTTSCCRSARFSSARSVRVLSDARSAPSTASTRDIALPWLARRWAIVQSLEQDCGKRHPPQEGRSAPSGVDPARQPNQMTAMPMRERTTSMLIRDSVAKSVSVPLERPVNASPTTGRTGTPQPASVQGPVVRPKTLVTAPATPAGRAALKPTPHASPSRLRYDQSAKYAPNTSEVRRMRKSVGTSTMNPHSMPSPPPLSALTQAMAMLERNDSFFARGSSDARYSGRRRSHGLKVKKSTGRRTMERMMTGAARLKTETAAVTARTIFARARTAAAIPRSACAMVARAL